MHSTIPAINEVEPAMFVRANVIGLNLPLAVGPRRHIKAFLARPQHVTDIHCAQSGIEVGDENEILPAPV